ncbi:hypothetical protein OH809_29170 [Streptomyces sp. NBC_00873]|uniref:hypothetical protein n=1 Tax=unclassified Streptomyces TaxID=2593676 RepID=UPI00386BA7DD|nr:hypothetical protein OH809_29170 [Streptomyces sp. NBC_00873]WTA49099.1 hypothetical protein OH821_14520 [Streptomyces sp. NBC_00842]
MRSPARLVTGTAAAALTAATLGLSTAAPSASAGDLGQLEISPADAAPGTTVTVNTTACGNDTKAAGDANSLEAGDFTLASTTREEVVVGTFTVPKKTHAGPYSIDVSCENGREVTGTLRVKAADTAKYAAAGSPAGTVEDNGSGGNTGSGNSVPSLDDLAARGESLLGNQNPFGIGNSSGNESGRGTGNGTGRGTGRDTGNGQGRDTGNGQGLDTGRDTGNGQGLDTGNGQGLDTGRDSSVPTSPSGHVKTGVGGSVRPDTSQIAAGAGVLAVSAVGGAWLLRRRASGTQADG